MKGRFAQESKQGHKVYGKIKFIPSDEADKELLEKAITCEWDNNFQKEKFESYILRLVPRGLQVVNLGTLNLNYELPIELTQL